MNGYELSDRLRKARRKYHLSAPTQALYHELVAICNEDEWPDDFRCSNNDLAKALRITEKSLILYRQDLIQSGLIYYKSGKSKKEFGTYSFSRPFENGCKIYNQSNSPSDSLSDSPSGNQSDSPNGEIPSDSNKTKTKTKQNQKVAPAKPARKEGAVGKKKSEEPEPFWDPLVEQWFAFNLRKFKAKPSFAGADPRHFKDIIQKLKRRAAEAGLEWAEATAPRRLIGFLKQAYGDPWLCKNFLLKNLNDQFDKITMGHADAAIASQQHPTPARGPMTMKAEAEYLYGRFQEGSLDEALIRSEHYDYLTSRGHLPVGSMAKFEAPTHDEQKRLAVLDFFKQKKLQDDTEKA